MKQTPTRPSLEALIERYDLDLGALHPGGLAITDELANLCHIGKGTKVLDVASGTGESCCHFAESFGADLTGVDASAFMLEQARRNATQRLLPIPFFQCDAQALPFADDSFDVVCSECTTCILDKERAIREMARVARPGGYVAIHDLCWKPNTPEQTKRRLDEIEGEHPEVLEGWKQLFEQVGLTEVVAVDKSELIPAWLKATKRKLGIAGQCKLFFNVIRDWGFSGLATVLESERIFQSKWMGYGIIAGRKS